MIDKLIGSWENSPPKLVVEGERIQFPINPTLIIA